MEFGQQKFLRFSIRQGDVGDGRCARSMPKSGI
jgi:hypothetical protein